MKKNRFFSIFLIICLIMTAAAPCASALEDPTPVAKYVVLADLDSGRLLFTKDMDTRTAPASLTKIMSVLLAVEAIENGGYALTDQVTAYADCRDGMDESSSTAGIFPGETMSLGDLMFCAMLASANEATNIIGEYLCGSIQSFVDMMNTRAAQLGCTNTHFANTNGLTNDDHYSTAHDMYLIAKEAISHPLFMTICNTATYEVPSTNASPIRTLQNSNSLISPNEHYGDGYLYEYAAGVKTGYTYAAGYCLISTAEKNQVRTMAVVMGSNGLLNTGDEEFYQFVDSIELYDWVFDNFSYQTVLDSNYPITSVTVDLADGDGIVILRPQRAISLLLPNDIGDDPLKMSYTVFEDKLVAPLDAGAVLGFADITVGDEYYGRINIVTANAVALSKSAYIKAKIAKTVDTVWFKVLVTIVVIVLVCYLLLVMRYRRLRQKHLKERKKAEARRRAEAERRRAEYGIPTVSEPTQRFSISNDDDGPSFEDIFDDIKKE